MSCFFLDLKASSGNEVAVPVSLPDAISFDCFIPGRSILRACLHPTSRDPALTDLGELEVWDPNDSTRTSIRLVGREDDAAVEQAGDVLDFVVNRLVRPCLITGEPCGARHGRYVCDMKNGHAGDHSEHNGVQLLSVWPNLEPAPVLRAIADMAEAEESAVAAFRELPESLRRAMRVTPVNLSVPEKRPSADALAAYIEALTEQAQSMAEKAAKEREGDWLAEQAEEYAASRRAERTDHAIDAWKDGL